MVIHKTTKDNYLNDMKGLKKFMVAVILLTTSLNSLALDGPQIYPIEISNDWQTVLEQDGILIEYKVQECNNLNVRNQVLVLFRYTNTSNEIKTIKWSTKEFRDGECYNCERLDTPENMHSMTLSPGETIEGDGTSKMDKRVYLFSHFIELVPGMSDQRLTDFEFVQLNVQSQPVSND